MTWSNPEVGGSKLHVYLNSLSTADTERIRSAFYVNAFLGAEGIAQSSLRSECRSVDEVSGQKY